MTNSKDTQVPATSLPEDSLEMLKPAMAEFKGRRFRNRMEARWGVFFDTLGLRWDYEPEVFDLPSGHSIWPTFWIPCETFLNGGYWIIITDSTPTSIEIHKCAGLSLGTGHITGIFCSTPHERTDTHSIGVLRDSGGKPLSTKIKKCDNSTKVLLTPLYAWAFRLCAHQNVDFEWGSVTSAIRAARSARFKHNGKW